MTGAEAGTLVDGDAVEGEDGSLAVIGVGRDGGVSLLPDPLTKAYVAAAVAIAPTSAPITAATTWRSRCSGGVSVSRVAMAVILRTAARSHDTGAPSFPTALHPHLRAVPLTASSRS